MALFDVLLHCARALDALHEGAATGGGTTTIVDSGLTAFGWQDDDFNQGTAFWTRDASVGVGVFYSRLVTDFVAASGTITVSPAFPASIEAGDAYGVMTKRYPRYVMVGKINEALQELGEILTVASINATGKREYALTGITGRIVAVHIGDTAADPQGWYREGMYQVLEDRILFERAIDVGKTIMLYYRGKHGYVSADSDTIDTNIGEDWLGLSAALRCARWRLQQPGADAQQQVTLVNDLMVREAAARARRRVWRNPPATNIFPLSYPEW